MSLDEILTDDTTGAGAILRAADYYAEALRNAEGVTHTLAEGSRPFRLTRDGAIQSLEAYLPAPTAIRQEVALDRLSSLVAYVRRFKTDDTLVYLNRPAGTVTAILDAPGPGRPSWGSHRAKITLSPTRSWAEWTKANKEPMSQEAFGQFLEDHIPDIVEPSGALLVEIARNLEANIGGRFQRGLRALDGSVTFAYTHTVDGSAQTTQGTVKVPDQVTLALRPFEALQTSFPLVGRLRYRIGPQGALLLWFDLLGAADVRDEALDLIGVTLRSDLGADVVLEGSAPVAVAVAP
jgi:uncharacterized protein YfdQ (DUF2303 family)